MAKYTPSQITLEKDIELRNFFDDTDKWLVRNVSEMRDELESKTRTSIEDYVTFFSNPVLRPKLSIDLQQALEHFEAGSRDDAVWVSTSLIRKEYNKAVDRISRAGKTLAHEDFSVVAGNFAICYHTLARLPAMVDKQGVNIPQRTTRGGRPQGSSRRVTNSQLNILIESFRKLYITATAVAQNPLQQGDTSLEVIRESLNSYFDGLSQTEHTITKNKHVDILTGRVEQKLSLKVQSKQGIKAEYEMGIMASLMKQGGAQNSLEVGIRKKFLDLFDEYGDQFMSVKGSKRTDKEVLEQVFDTVKGKKTKAYKSNTSKTVKTNAKFKNPIDNKLKRAAAKALAVKAIKRVPKSRRATGQKEEKQGVSEKDVLKLKRIINRRLPAQVRRNMGRPALINRTGRFSNSVKLVNLRQGPKTLVGKYNYQLDPYATFENRGARQWPAGYNPKPLITKSIRDIAIKHTEQKFTLRRE